MNKFFHFFIWELKQHLRDPFSYLPLLLASVIFTLVNLVVLRSQTDPRIFTTLYVLNGLFPFSFVVSYAADSFAGEKERKTWDSLMLFPVPLPLILLSKFVSILCLPMALYAFITFVYLIFHSQGYDWLLIQFYLFFNILFITFGVIYLSLKAKTIRQAAQMGSLLLTLIFLINSFFSGILLASFYNLLNAILILSLGSLFFLLAALRQLKS